MTQEMKKRIHAIYGIVLSVVTVFAGICFIAACLNIYRSGIASDAAQIYTRKIVAQAFVKISVPVYACLILVIGGMVLDHFIFGIDIKRKVCILSPKYEEITQFILHELHSGASHYDLYGAYDGSVRREIVTIVDKQEYRKLMDYVHKADPKAFVTVYSVNEIRYQPKK